MHPFSLKYRVIPCSTVKNSLWIFHRCPSRTWSSRTDPGSKMPLPRCLDPDASHERLYESSYALSRERSSVNRLRDVCIAYKSCTLLTGDTLLLFLWLPPPLEEEDKRGFMSRNWMSVTRFAISVTTCKGVCWLWLMADPSPDIIFAVIEDSK
jgi:hypothetical protein